jgi:hypothetical protein
MVSFLQALALKFCTHFFSLPYATHLTYCFKHILHPVKRDGKLR